MAAFGCSFVGCFDDRQSCSMSPDAVWRVGCQFGFDVTDPATVVLQVAPAQTTGVRVMERLDVSVEGRALEAERFTADHGGLVDMFRAPIGDLQISYEAVISRGAPAVAELAQHFDNEQMVYLRQSRYCPSDAFSGFAAYELGHLPPGRELLDAVGDWVASRLTYEEGFGGPLDTAVDTFFAGRGVCRDFAHLAITVLRALEVPSRLVAVYAPGLSPMEFHAVVEAHVAGRWWILDPTRLAPRQSLVRVSTGRDASDTAFITVIGGDALLVHSETMAVIDGDLPLDDHLALIALS
jgi:hypothetical protein